MAKTQAKGQIRIIGGSWRGRRLPVLDAEGLRPTSDRVKETLFNWIQFDLQETHVVDLFAGSGSLGFEALSRGAAHCTFVETRRDAAQQLQCNAGTLGAATTIETAGAETWLSKNQAVHANIMFIDPPFGKQWLKRIIPMLSENQVLAENALVYIECERDEPFADWPADWQLLRDKQAGQVHFRLFRRG